MSGLLERIVRRRRASASSRLGPPTQNGHPSPDEPPYLNGDATELAVTHVNGSAGAVEAPEVVDEAQAAESLEGIEVIESRPEALDAPDAVETPQPEPEAIEVPETEPEPEAIEVPETEPEWAVEDSDEPAPIEDGSPTMEHRVLVLDELEDAAAGADPAADPGPDSVGAAEPTDIPAKPVRAPGEPPVPEPHFRGRSRVRRRARYLRKLREIQLRDIGGFAVELHRFGIERPDLLAAKIADAAQTDAELRALEEALGGEEPLRELREAGIGGVCANCGTVHGSEDQFCAMCGEPVARNSRGSRPSTEFDDYFSQG
jgi:hypothetical protein